MEAVGELWPGSRIAEPWPTPSASTWPQPDWGRPHPPEPLMFRIPICQALKLPPNAALPGPVPAQPCLCLPWLLLIFWPAEPAGEHARFNGALIAREATKLLLPPLPSLTGAETASSLLSPGALGRPRLFLLLTHSMTLDESRWVSASALKWDSAPLPLRARARSIWGKEYEFSPSPSHPVGA